MTEQAKRKSKYSDEFRADAVRLVIDQELPVAQVARVLGMPQNTLHSWVKKARAHDRSSEGPLSRDERAELHGLRRELHIVREEREILKVVGRAPHVVCWEVVASPQEMVGGLHRKNFVLGLWDDVGREYI